MYLKPQCLGRWKRRSRRCRKKDGQEFLAARLDPWSKRDSVCSYILTIVNIVAVSQVGRRALSDSLFNHLHIESGKELDSIGLNIKKISLSVNFIKYFEEQPYSF